MMSFSVMLQGLATAAAAAAAAAGAHVVLADVSACCQVVLPLLCGPHGLASSVDSVRGVAADVICNAVKNAGPAQVRLM
jgi:hypothetical protein